MLKYVFPWESVVKYLSKSGLQTKYFLDRSHQFSFLRLFVQSLFTKLNMNGNNGEIELDKEETFKLQKDSHFISKSSFLSNN